MQTFFPLIILAFTYVCMHFAFYPKVLYRLSEELAMKVINEILSIRLFKIKSMWSNGLPDPVSDKWNENIGVWTILYIAR